MEVKQDSDFINDRKDLQVDEKVSQKPDSPKDYGKDVGKEPLEVKGRNVLVTLANTAEPALRDKICTEENQATGIRMTEYDEEIMSEGRKRVPTYKGKQYSLEKMKSERKVALSNITRQINKIKPLLSSYSNQKLVRIEAKELDELFVLMQDIHEKYLKALDDEEEIKHAVKWYDVHDKEVFTFKQNIVDYLNEAKICQGEEFDRSSMKSKRSYSKRSFASESSSRSHLMQAKAKTAALEIKAAFLKENQALKMATEELELKQEIALAKAEERIYEQFEQEETDKESFEKLKLMQVKYISTPITTQSLYCPATSKTARANYTFAAQEQPNPVSNVADLPRPTSATTIVTFSTSPTMQTTVSKNSDPGAGIILVCSDNQFVQ